MKPIQSERAPKRIHRLAHTAVSTSSRDLIRRGRWGGATAIIESGRYGGLYFGMGTERRNGPNSRWAHQGIRRAIERF
jgi:hypothetical protein